MIGDLVIHVGFLRFARIWFRPSGYWTVLEVDMGCEEKKITKAYRKLALICHPDKGGDVDLQQKLNHMYNHLKEHSWQYFMSGVDAEYKRTCNCFICNCN